MCAFVVAQSTFVDPNERFFSCSSPLRSLRKTFFSYAEHDATHLEKYSERLCAGVVVVGERLLFDTNSQFITRT